MSTNGRIELTVLSPPEFNDLIVEAEVGGELLFVLSQEQGWEHLVVAIHSRSDNQPWELPLDEFRAALDRAVQRLEKMRQP